MTDSFQIDMFTKDIRSFEIKLEKEQDPIKKQSYSALITRLKGKRDRLSKLLWKKTYQDAVDSLTYEPWI